MAEHEHEHQTGKPTRGQVVITFFAFPILGVYLGALLGGSIGVGVRVYSWVLAW